MMADSTNPDNTQDVGGNQVDNSVERRALRWLLGGDTGVSSKTLCAHMLGGDVKLPWRSPPSDASDRGRCIRLLELIPEWIPRLDEMAETKSHVGIVIDKDGIHEDRNSWAKQIELIRQEMVTDLANTSPDTNNSSSNPQSQGDTT